MVGLAELGQEEIVVREDGATAWVILNRPERRNATTTATQLELARVLTEIGKRDDLRVVVLTGAGTAFCAGHDVSELMDKYTDTAEKVFLPGRTGVVANAILGLPQVSIAMVNGPAIGEGVDIALACDLIVASRKAFLADLHLRRGVVPGMGCWVLPRAIGSKRAAAALFLGERIDAEDALAMGLVNEVADDENLGAATDALVERLLDVPALGLRYTKRAVQKGAVEELGPTLEFISFARGILSKTSEASKQGQAYFDAKTASQSPDGQ